MIDRADGDLAAGAAELRRAALVDAKGQNYPHPAHLLPFTSPDPSRPLFGPAATMAFVPDRDDLPKTDFAPQARGADPQGRALVMSRGEYPETSHGGATKLSRVDRHPIAEVRVDGRLRDFAQLDEYKFLTWCRAEATQSGGNIDDVLSEGRAVEEDAHTVEWIRLERLEAMAGE